MKKWPNRAEKRPTGEHKLKIIFIVSSPLWHGLKQMEGHEAASYSLAL